MIWGTTEMFHTEEQEVNYILLPIAFSTAEME